MNYCQGFLVFGFCVGLIKIRSPDCTSVNCQIEPGSIIPNKTHCGKQHTDDYVYKENDTSVDEFPWMVYVITQNGVLNKNNKFEVNMGVGVIISTRYILTEKLEYTTISVRVGQHHILKDKNCIPTEYWQDDCTAPSKVISVEQHFTRENSIIALLRIGTEIIWEESVRPICLPFPQFKLKRVKKGGIVFTSGWGTEDFIDGQKIQVKKRIKHIVLDNYTCSKGNPIQNPICSNTFKNTTSFVCSNDNGGPIMYKSRKNTWIVEGIISGRKSCAIYQPVNAERITEETLNWILDKIVA